MALSHEGVADSRSDAPRASLFAGKRVAFLGKLGSMNRREAMELVRRCGGRVVASESDEIDLLVIGADFSQSALEQTLLESRQREARGERRPRIVLETDVWEELGFIDPEVAARRLYTPAMLADLLGVPISTIRTWARRRLITPVREIHRLPYFDFQEVLTARHLAKLLQAGVSAATLDKNLRRIAEWIPGIQRRLAQLSVIVQGRDLLLRVGGGLVDQDGQRRFDFDREDPQTPGTLAGNEGELSQGEPDPSVTTVPFPAASGGSSPPRPGDPCFERAMEAEEEGEWQQAIELYRSALFAEPARAELHFALAEALYRIGDSSAARERYFCAIELDEDFVEARANLGCVLAEESQYDLAIAAFQGALTRHPDYADVHYHLARLLDRQRRDMEAEPHWREFLRLAPESPWADEARDRLGLV